MHAQTCRNGGLAVKGSGSGSCWQSFLNSRNSIGCFLRNKRCLAGLLDVYRGSAIKLGKKEKLIFIYGGHSDTGPLEPLLRVA
jgi:hypothetical protein